MEMAGGAGFTSGGPNGSAVRCGGSRDDRRGPIANRPQLTEQLTELPRNAPPGATIGLPRMGAPPRTQGPPRPSAVVEAPGDSNVIGNDVGWRFSSGQRARLRAARTDAPIADGTAAGSRTTRLRPCRSVPPAAGRTRLSARQTRHPRRHSAPALHHQGRSARHLSLRTFRQPHRGYRAAARFERHHRQAHRGRLHASRIWRSGPA